MLQTLASAFDAAAAMWAAYHAMDDAPDAMPGTPHYAASELQDAIVNAATNTPAATVGDLAHKVRIANGVTRAGLDAPTDLLASIEADAARLAADSQAMPLAA
jgi:hypothetical protein